MPKDPEQAVRVLFHIYRQFSKCPHKAYYLHKIFSPELQKLQNSQDIGHYIFQMGKHKGRKDATKLQNTVQQMKSKFSSLRKASFDASTFDAHLGLTNFFQHSLAQSTIYIHTMHKADR